MILDTIVVYTARGKVKSGYEASIDDKHRNQSKQVFFPGACRISTVSPSREQEWGWFNG